MTMVRREVIIQSPTRPYHFKFEVRASSSRSDRLLPESFYLKGDPPTIPEGLHHEFLILEAPVSAYWRSNKGVRAHIYHNTKTGFEFVCWTMPVPTLEDANAILDWWCLGTVYTIEHGPDFVDLLAEHPEDLSAFLKGEHGIWQYR